MGGIEGYKLFLLILTILLFIYIYIYLFIDIRLGNNKMDKYPNDNSFEVIGVIPKF